MKKLFENKCKELFDKIEDKEKKENPELVSKSIYIKTYGLLVESGDIDKNRMFNLSSLNYTDNGDNRPFDICMMDSNVFMYYQKKWIKK